MRRSLAGSWILVAASLVLVAVTNADALIDDVHDALPWTSGGCDVWSARFYAVAITLSGAGVFFGARAGRGPGGRTAATRTAAGLSGLLLLYWVVLATLAALSMCVYN